MFSMVAIGWLASCSASSNSWSLLNHWPSKLEISMEEGDCLMTGTEKETRLFLGIIIRCISDDTGEGRVCHLGIDLNWMEQWKNGIEQISSEARQGKAFSSSHLCVCLASLRFFPSPKQRIKDPSVEEEDINRKAGLRNRRNRYTLTGHKENKKKKKKEEESPTKKCWAKREAFLSQSNSLALARRPTW